MRIAIVGSGISGLASAHLLRRAHDVVVYEASDRIGGHTHTVDVSTERADAAVDTGFIVFNEENYPLFSRLLSELGVRSRPSDMSFSVRDDRDGIEYRGSSLAHVFAQKRNLLRPSFHRMLWDIRRFYRDARRMLEEDSDQLTLGDYLRRERYGRRFVEQHILPLGAALWSTGEKKMEAFPLSFLLRFLDNHKLLQFRGHPEWRVIEGGSREYVRQLVRPFRESIRTGSPVRRVVRENGRVRIFAEGSPSEDFDAVVLACHSDQALRMLDTPSVAEHEVLSDLPYSSNRVTLHTDTTSLPRRRKAWASWNYHVRRDREISARPTVSYHMNRLQGLSPAEDYVVTLNDDQRLDPARVLERIDYEHPLYTRPGVRARARVEEINGRQQTWYCGAYWGWGFHEDGVRSAARVARDFGLEL